MMPKSAAFPLARSERLLTSEVDGELVVYDRDTDEAHLLSGSLATVWGLCDGFRSVEAIAAAIGVPGRDEAVGVVELALEELQAAGLLQTPATPVDTGLSRRALLVKMGIAGAAVPTILTLAAAPAYAAPCPASCSTSGECNQTGCLTRLHCCIGAVLFNNTCVTTQVGTVCTV